MIRNLTLFIISSIAYQYYVVNIFFTLPPEWNLTINFLLIPMFMGLVLSALFIGDLWIKIVLSAMIPIIPMAVAGSFVDTGGINIAYIGPLMVGFAIGSGIYYLITRIIAKNSMT